MPRLTKKIIEATEPAEDGNDSFLWDDSVSGFGVRTYASGTKTFIFRYRSLGMKQRFLSLGKVGEPYTVEEAREKSRFAMKEVMEGRDPQEAKVQSRKALTIDELTKTYLAEAPKWREQKRFRSWDSERGLIQWHISPLLGKKMAEQLTKSDIVKFKDAVKIGKTAQQVKTKTKGLANIRGGEGAAARAITCLQTVYEWARKAGILTIDNPCKGVERAKPRKVERMMKADDVSRLVTTLDTLEKTHQLNKPWGDIIRLLLLTGARCDEIVSLKWSEIDLEKSLIRLMPERHKTGGKTGAKNILLPSLALTIIQSTTKTSEFVFPARKKANETDKLDTPVQGIGKAWRKIRETAELNDLRIHDLRHIFATYAVSQGESLYLTGKALGHSSQHMTERYSHAGDDPVHQLVERTAKGLFGK
jgi:integrase